MPNSSEAPSAAGVPAPAERQKIIIRTSVIGIVTNLLLSGFKAVEIGRAHV